MENETKIRTAVLFGRTKCFLFFRLLKCVFFFFVLFSIFGNCVAEEMSSREKLGILAKKDMQSHSESIIWGKWKDLIRKYTDKVRLSLYKEELKNGRGNKTH